MKLVILDRDGVINYESAAYIKNPDELIPLPGSIESIARLSAAGYTILVATNQSGVGRGKFTLDALQAMHAKILQLVEAASGSIYKIYYCPHTPYDNCTCRKPKTGMLEQMERDLDINIRELRPPFVGDSVCDIELGIAMNCRPFLVTGTGSHGQDTLQKLSMEQLAQATVVENLVAAVEIILDA